MPKNTESTVDQAAIAIRAYQLFLERGGEHGHADEDWQRAEQELRAAMEQEPHRGPVAPPRAPAAAVAAVPAPAEAKPAKSTKPATKAAKPAAKKTTKK
jgi:hypothetical protein